jgi:hypothetical protein
LFKIPLFRLSKFVKKLGGISLGGGGKISRISEILWKNDDVTARNFNFSRRVDFRLLLALYFSFFMGVLLCPRVFSTHLFATY